MNHVIFYSGGLGSWATARRVVRERGKDNTFLLFTDTLIEDEDLYRFLIETAGQMYGIGVSDLIIKTKEIPTTHEEIEHRKSFLDELGRSVSERIPNFAWINNGQDVWDVFYEKRFLGNSRLAHCSHVLKQDLAREYIFYNFFPVNTTLYLGLDWTEEHRTKAPAKNWKPFNTEFPLCEKPFLTNVDHVKELERIGIEAPRLYAMGFAHNNCGGFCVRGGQGHFANLLKQRPELYAYHERREQEIIEFLDQDVSILRKQRDGVRYNYTLKELREDIERGETNINLTDIGGCGCFAE